MFAQLPIHIIEYSFSFLSGVQPACKSMQEANTIPELQQQRLENALSKYQNALQACIEGDESSAILIIKNVYQPPDVYFDLEMMAANQGMYRLCEELLNHPRYITPDNIAYYGAAHYDIIKLAVNHGADTWHYFCSPIVESGDVQLLQKVLQLCNIDLKPENWTHHAGYSQNIDMIKFVMDRIAINKDIIDEVLDGISHRNVVCNKTFEDIHEMIREFLAYIEIKTNGYLFSYTEEQVQMYFTESNNYESGAEY